MAPYYNPSSYSGSSTGMLSGASSYGYGYNGYQTYGTPGDDTLTGGAGDDLLDGGNGHDVLLGGGGNDSVNGGDGNDHLFGQSPAGGTDGADSLNGGDGSDYLQGNAGNDMLDGGMGSDRMNGGADDDAMTGDAGNDTMNGNRGNDIVDGGDGNDSLRGGQGNDSLSGGAGNDMLSGDLGQDSLSGGDGIDVFLFSGQASPIATPDRIADFDPAADRLALGFAPAALLTGASQADLAAASSFAQSLMDGHAGDQEVVALAVGADTYLFYSSSGGAMADSAVLLAGVNVSAVVPGDFI
ncbi:calcium-binding protein [Rhizorhabdus argentea]|uniref:calcium-binding protein n=1 Tax=Rhizorhabdus argentea TaxID=1387174 RepID=UPI0030EBBE08